MAKQKLLRMAFTRGDVGALYRGLQLSRAKLIAEAEADPSLRVTNALEIVDLDALADRIVKGIASLGGLGALAHTLPPKTDIVAEHHAARVASKATALVDVAHEFAQPSPLTGKRASARKRKAGAK